MPSQRLPKSSDTLHFTHPHNFSPSTLTGRVHICKQSKLTPSIHKRNLLKRHCWEGWCPKVAEVTFLRTRLKPGLRTDSMIHNAVNCCAMNSQCCAIPIAVAAVTAALLDITGNYGGHCNTPKITLFFFFWVGTATSQPLLLRKLKPLLPPNQQE